MIDPLRRLMPFFALLSFVALIHCGGGAAVGESCSAEGKEGECEDGAVCGKNVEALECLKVCVEKSDCPAGYDCNGTSGSSIKGCRPEDPKK
jgi:hypothetical protein